LPGAAARTQHGCFLGRLVRVVRVVGDRGSVPGFQLVGLESPPCTVNGVLDGSGPAPVVLGEFGELAGRLLVEPDCHRVCHTHTIPPQSYIHAPLHSAVRPGAHLPVIYQPVAPACQWTWPIPVTGPAGQRLGTLTRWI